MKTLIVGGNGHVGQALSWQLSRLGHSVSLFGSRDSRTTYLAHVAESDVVFIAIPTRDKGEIALGYILEALNKGKPVITCEKGALAYHYEKLKPYLSQIGYMATVGGGSGMLSLLSSPQIQLKRIVGVVNGTLNFMFSEYARIKDTKKLLAEVGQLGLCEPGQLDLGSVCNAEIHDMILKLVNVFNLSGVSDKVLHVSELGSLYLCESEILYQLKKQTRRFVISISKERSLSTDSLYDCLHVWKDGWCAEIGIVEVTSQPFKMLPRFEENTLLIEDYAGVTQIMGKGAGAIPTAGAMISDMSKVLS